MQLTRTHRILIGVVVAGALVIAGIGFAGSYAAVRELALKKGFGNFSYVFPIGIDAGICVLLALDLLLTWIRIPFPLLRQTAWLLTAATIAFNGAAAWPDPLGVGMHAVIPVLFVVSVEAARHAIGRIADITADKHMEGVRITRWLLSPVPTFRLWRRMKLWELRSYDQVIKLEQERLVYQARLRSRFGRRWRRKAPVESLMPLRMARYGVPLSETAPAGLAAAGIEPVLLPPSPASPTPTVTAPPVQPELTAAAAPRQKAAPEPEPAAEADPEPDPQPNPRPEDWPREQLPQGAHQSPWFAAHQQSFAPVQSYEEWYAEQAEGQSHDSPAPEQAPDTQQFPVPAGPGRTRPLADTHLIPGPRREQRPEQPADEAPAGEAPADEPFEGLPIEAPGLPEGLTPEEAYETYYTAFRQYVGERSDYPNSRQFGLYLMDLYGVTGESGGPVPESTVRPYLKDFRDRYQQELDPEQIA